MNTHIFARLRQSAAAALAAAGALLVSACTTVPAAAPVAAAQGPALWKVADKDTTIYLFGTVHALPDDTEWFGGEVAAALARSGSIVTELPPGALTDPASQQVILGRAMLPEGKTLRAMLTTDQRAAYEAAMAKVKLPVQAFDRLEPWFAAMTLSVAPLLQNGFKADQGVEKILESKAGTIERGAVETLDGQMALFDDLPQDAQIAYLMSTIENLDEVAPTLAEMVGAWKVGDADRLAALMNESMKDDPTLADRLLYARNRDWAEWIDRRLDQPGTVFMAVGAGHLAGDRSVQDALEKRGIKTVRVQ